MDKRITKSLVVVLCILWCQASASAPESDVDRYIAAIEQRYVALQDFHADFEQETRLPSVSSAEKGNGSVYFKKGGKMLWHYKKPEEQKIILDGKTLWIYIPAEKQVMKNNFSAVPQHIVVDIFRGHIVIKDKFSVELLSQEGAVVALELVPREYDPTVKKLRLWFDYEKKVIIKTQLEDELGTQTTLVFKNIAVDKGVKDTLFEFTPPKGVEVFEPPQV